MQERPKLTVCSPLGPQLAVCMVGARQPNLAKEPLGLD